MRLPSGARGFESLRLRSAIEQLYKNVTAQSACILSAGLERSFSSADLLNLADPPDFADLPVFCGASRFYESKRVEFFSLSDKNLHFTIL